MARNPNTSAGPILGEQTLDGEELTFGNSSMLYQNDLLLYDHQTESLWSQLQRQAITGPMAGTYMEWLPATHMQWHAYRSQYPGGSVLSLNTGFQRNYASRTLERHIAPERHRPATARKQGNLPNRAWVVGVLLEGAAKAYAVESLAPLDGEPLHDQIDGTEIRLRYEPELSQTTVERIESGSLIPSVLAYWGAWQRFYPETALYYDPVDPDQNEIRLESSEVQSSSTSSGNSIP